MPTKAVSKQEIEGLNNLLSDVYHRDFRLSIILGELGFSDQQIIIVKERCLRQLVVIIQETLKEFIFSRADGERIWHILS
jgi:uncharacterized protein (UPF0216 family)